MPILHKMKFSCGKAKQARYKRYICSKTWLIIHKPVWAKGLNLCDARPSIRNT